MTPRRERSSWFRRACGAVGLLLFTACGGIAIVEDGPAGGAGGSGTTSTGAASSTKCITGECGDVCTRCEGSDCKAGRCDSSSMCIVGAVPSCD